MIGLLVGVLDGSDVTGWNVGFLEGSSVVGFVEGGEDGGKVVGRSVGLADGKLIGAADVGLFEGSLLGGEEGLGEGIFVGRLVGFSVLGRRVIGVGRGVGRGVGSLVGHLVGFSVLGRRVIGVRLGLGRGVGSLVGFTGCCDGLRDFDVGVGGCDGCRDGIGEALCLVGRKVWVRASLLAVSSDFLCLDEELLESVVVWDVVLGALLAIS